MKKKLIIIGSISFSIFILAWIALIILFPVSIINNVSYSTYKIKKLSKQRLSDYQELYASTQIEINNNIKVQLFNLFYQKLEYNEFDKCNLEKQITRIQAASATKT